MAAINPFNGRKDLMITFYGNNDKVMAMFRILAIDFRDSKQLAFLEKYENVKPYENEGFTSFEKDVETNFKLLGALACQSIVKSVELMDGEIKYCKCEVVKDW